MNSSGTGRRVIAWRNSLDRALAGRGWVWFVQVAIGCELLRALLHRVRLGRLTVADANAIVAPALLSFGATLMLLWFVRSRYGEARFATLLAIAALCAAVGAVCDLVFEVVLTSLPFPSAERLLPARGFNLAAVIDAGVLIWALPRFVLVSPKRAYLTALCYSLVAWGQWVADIHFRPPHPP